MSARKERFNINLGSNINSSSGPGTAKRSSVNVQKFIRAMQAQSAGGTHPSARVHPGKVAKAIEHTTSTKSGKKSGLRAKAKSVKGKSKYSHKTPSAHALAVKSKSDTIV